MAPSQAGEADGTHAILPDIPKSTGTTSDLH
jgi:hypothetical protein